jgi:multidrug transporter EmrE-like cation transporter
LAILLIFLLNYKQRKAYRNKRKRSRITAIGTVIIAILISYFFLDRGFTDISIGIKYGFWRIFILLSATAIGFFYQKTLNTTKSI